MSHRSSSRLSVTRASESSRPSVQRSTKSPVNLKSGTRSAVSLLWPGRASALFRTVKAGYKVPRYQNNYRLTSYHPFNCEFVEKTLENVLNGTLTGIKYNPAFCMKLCQDMSSEVRSRIYKEDYDRYKYIVRFTIFQKMGQSINMATGRLADVERDTHCSRTFENTEIIAIGTVYGIYYE